MYEIWFSNSGAELGDGDRMAQCPDMSSAFSVYDALCGRFLHVEMFDKDGVQIRHYNNT